MHKFNIKNLQKLDSPKRRQTMPPEETLRKFNISDRGTFLDIGCGIGYFTIPAANILNQGKVIGLDIMSEIIDIAKEKATNISNIEFITSEEYTFPVEAASIDYVFICTVLHEIEDKPRYFKEIKRVLKPNAFLCIIDWEKKETEVGPSVSERISKEEMIQFCALANFAHVEDININADHYGLKLRLG
ncbi:class I SAM-dependent methyltransferase [Clostridium sp.]|uniref:class I SAM-dependent methyltransferase n=1 Tax=Clostridium sp. TaxID=1506 RepID=UPI001A4B1EF4|nr:class I SAM-dependent methyltransferase [Clostridium sp.]MBK5235363.1 methyltransferase domain-containing protein [Clostridium sp.]